MSFRPKSRVKSIAYKLLGFLAIPLVSLASVVCSLIATTLIIAIIASGLHGIFPAAGLLATGIPLVLLLTYLALSLYLYVRLNRKAEDMLHSLSSNLFEGDASNDSHKNQRLHWRHTSSILMPAIFLLVLVIIPSWIDFRGSPPYHIRAKHAVASAAKECAVRLANGEQSPSFSAFAIPHYKIVPKGRSCAGDEKGEIAAISNDNSAFPDFYIGLSEPYTKRCSHSARANEFLGCSARVDGRW